jgi:hypothetical protein
MILDRTADHSLDREQEMYRFCVVLLIAAMHALAQEIPVEPVEQYVRQYL